MDEDRQEVEQRGPARAGSLLHEARVRSERSVDDCARELRARVMQIEAMERGDLEPFGGDIYARGFLRSYARLLGLDEEEILDLHGNDPAFDAPKAPVSAIRIRQSTPGWLVGLMAVVALAGGLVAVLVLGGQRAPDTVAAVDPGIDAPDEGTTGSEPEPEPDPPVAPQDPEPADGPPIDLVLTFEAASWLEVLVDGLPLRPEVLVGGVPLRPEDGNGITVPAGNTLRFTGQEEVVLRFGNAGGVRVESGGLDLGAMGRTGEVLRVAFGPEGRLDEVG